MPKQKFTGATGLPLPRRAVRVLRERGIFAHPIVSVEHQHLAERYVLRGLESGGSTGDIGRYVTFAGTDGQRLECFHPVESIAVNGLHAIVIGSEVLRVDMVRKDRTYELLVTEHRLSAAENGSRPLLETAILFRGVHGRLELDLTRRDKTQAGKVIPSFYSFAGERVNIPERLMAAIRAATHGVNCIGCAHSHYVRKSSAHQFTEASSTRPESAIEVQSA